jgi:hypothetical protein
VTSFPRRFALVAFSTVSIFALDACRNVANVPHEGVEYSKSTQLKEKPPIEIAVAPIKNGAGANVPVDELRAAFQKSLVSRHYSPLALEWIDKKVVDATYTPGAASEQAVLIVEIDRFDTSFWESHNALQVKFHVRLVDVATGSELWSARLERRLDFGREVKHFSSESGRMTWACDHIAERILETLPTRQARPGYES